MLHFHRIFLKLHVYSAFNVMPLYKRFTVCFEVNQHILFEAPCVHLTVQMVHYSTVLRKLDSAEGFFICGFPRVLPPAFSASIGFAHSPLSASPCVSVSLSVVMRSLSVHSCYCHRISISRCVSNRIPPSLYVYLTLTYLHNIQ